ncbi:MAG: GNAT family N-acetyltransferase [Bacteroidales bacterium]
MIECRKTTIADIDKIMQIIREAQNYFKAANIDQWQNGYPNESVFAQDILMKRSYVFTLDNEIIATAMISFDGEPTYAHIDGSWLSDQPYGVIHRIAVKSSIKGNNVAGNIIAKATEMASERGISSLRIDTHRQNTAMQKVILKSGFKYCGIIHLNDGAERFAYQLDF